MADDIRLSTALPQHPKLRKLQRRLGDSGCWALIKLFCWIGDNRSNGNLAGLTDEDLELAIDWSGPKSLIQVLRDVGFIEGESLDYRVHDWLQHQPYIATRSERVQRARDAAAARWGKTTQEQRQETGRELTDARLQKQQTTCDSRAASTLPDVPPTYEQHDSNVPSTHARTPRTTPNQKPSPRAQNAAPSEAAINLAAFLRIRILQNNPAHLFKPGQEHKWAREAELMLARDHRSEQQIRTLIEWSQSDPFWRTNILSMKKLREKFDQLVLKKNSNGHQHFGGRDVPGPESISATFAR